MKLYGFLVLLVLAAFLFIGILLIKSYTYDMYGVAIAGTSGIILAVLLIMLLVGYTEGKNQVAMYAATVETLEQARNSANSEIERAAIQRDVLEFNRNLASVKYWNNTIFDLWNYDGYAKLKFIR